MRYLVIIVASTISIISCDQSSLHRICPTECWAIPGISYGVTNDNRNSIIYKRNNKDRAGIGLCKTGKPICDDNFNIIECDGEVLPKNEICDGKDNDCNGLIDDQWTDAKLIKYSTIEICRQNGVCLSPKAYCENGVWVCQYPNTYEEIEISCDRLDNDCNGAVDDIPPRGACFNDDWWKATNPPCHLGVDVCYQGFWQCVNQTTPEQEICNRVDDDCDGIIDNDITDAVPIDYDIVFIIDTSGSMGLYISAVADALKMYVEQFDSNPYYKFALVIMTHTPNPLVEVIVPFGNLSDIVNELSIIGSNGAGAEASLDSLDMVCNISNPLNLDWRYNSGRLAFEFTDEEDQSYTNPETTSDTVVDNCNASITTPYIWGFEYPYEFQYIASAAGGKYFTLSRNTNTMFDNLNDIILLLCGG